MRRGAGTPGASGGRSAVGRLDPLALAARARYLPPLQPGQSVWKDEEIAWPRPTWEGAFDGPELTSLDEATGALRDALEQAVERALEGATRAAVITGGGVDSSALLALAHGWAARGAGRTVFGVALDFGGRGDDRPHLARVEAHLGGAVERVAPEAGAAHVHLVWSGVLRAPFTWPGGPMEVALLTRARELGAEVALMGIGADDLLDGIPHALARRARAGDFGAAIRAARKLEGFAAPRFRALSWVARPLVAARVPPAIRRWRAERGSPETPAWAGPVMRSAAVRARRNELARLFARAPGASTEAPRARFEAFLTAAHLEHLAQIRAQESAAAGIVRRDPFLDPALVAVVARTSPELLLAGDVRRGLFRRAVADLLPASVVGRLDKAEFTEAFARFGAAVGGLGAFRRLADVRELASLGVIGDVGAFRAAFERFAAGDETGWAEVWPVLTVEAFVRAVREGREAA